MHNIEYPRIHLAIDNCFAIKRWVEPRDWMRIINEIGDIKYIEASTDNEIDPSHNTQEFRDAWVSEVKDCEREFNQKVISFYSGYATYRTVGIASLSESKRQAMIDKYFKPTVDVAAKLGAQVGNALSAFSEPVLNQPELYNLSSKYLDYSLSVMTEYAGKQGVLFGYEQMYTPTQGMWKIQECINRMKSAYTTTGLPMYVTIDTAHQVGQKIFRKPDRSDIEKMLESGDCSSFRLPEKVEKQIAAGDDIDKIMYGLADFDYWFADPADADVFSWLSSLGCYSPLMHLQQTDGSYSSHKPFTEKYNKGGIIDPREVLKAIAKSYETDEAGMPPKVTDIYLAFEIFFGVTDPAKMIIDDLRESVAYWRKYIPQDGLPLNELVASFN